MSLGPTSDSSFSDSKTALVTFALGLVFCAPLVLATWPPMLDYPQHLAMATILAKYTDPGFGFSEFYFRFFTKPNAFFEYVVAAAMAVVSANVAGKIVLACALIATGFSATALSKRVSGRWWMGLAALPIFYSHLFYWGFVGSLIAVPFFFAALTYADRNLETVERVSVRVILFALTLSFYVVHAQFALLFAGAVVWLHICNGSGFRQFKAVLPPVVIAAALSTVFTTSTTATPGTFEQSISAAPIFKPLGERLAVVSELVFGAHAQHADAVVSFLALLLLVLAVSGRQSGQAQEGRLYRTRFLTLAGWIWLMYFVFPLNFGQYLIQERMAPLAASLLLISLPRFEVGRERLAQGLLAAMLFVQWAGVSTGALIFDEEAAGVEEVMEGAEPGKKLMGLVADRRSLTLRHPDVYVHFPAIYQVLYGGQVNFSFAELIHSIASPKPGKSFDPILAEVTPRNLKYFSMDRHGDAFDYFLVRGTKDDVARFVGSGARQFQIRSKGRWHFLW